MAYQSKTYSLSDEVVAAIENARERGLTPNKYLRALIALETATNNGEFTTLDTMVARLDTIGSELSQGRGKASTETYRVPRGLREKGDSKR